MKLLPILALFVVLTIGGKKSKGGSSAKVASSGYKQSSAKVASASSSKSKTGSSSKTSTKTSSKGGSTSTKTSGTGGYNGTPSPIYTPSDEELCGCFELDLVCAPTVINNEICYYYLITKTSDDDYCGSINDITLGTNNNDCGLTSTDIDSYLLDYAPKCYDIDPLSANGININLDNSSPSDSYGSDSSAKSGTKSGTKSGGSSSAKVGGGSSTKTGSASSTKTGSASGSKTGGSGSGSSTKSSGSGSASGSGGSPGSAPSVSQDDYIIFSMCFDASQVAGFQSTGQVVFNTVSGQINYTSGSSSSKTGGGSSSKTASSTKTNTKSGSGSASGSKVGGSASGSKVGGSGSGTGSKTSSSGGYGSGSGSSSSGSYNFGTRAYTCDVYTVLPNFCGTPEPTTAAPTTAEPTTSEPTTANPTSAAPTTTEPTTSDPTTAAPTTSDPTTANPTSAAPTTSNPTTTAPTTSDPTTAEPTTAEPTTSEPTARPTTSDPTTADPTTSEPTARPTTSDPTTADPTTAEPTTSQPSKAPVYSVCDSDDALNVAFLLDESGSVSASEWDILKNFVKRIVEYDVSPESYVALYEFAGLTGFRDLLPFTQNDVDGQAEIIQNLDDNTYSIAGFTETWDAVNRVLDDISEYQSSEATVTWPNGINSTTGGTSCYGDVTDECWRRENILFILTDGNPTDQACYNRNGVIVDSQYCTCLTGSTSQLESRLSATTNVDVVLILIDAGQDIDQDLVDCLDTADNQQDVITLTSFDSAAFTDIEIRIRDKICANNGVPCKPCSDESASVPECESCKLAEWTPYVYDDGRIGLGPVPEGNGGGAGCSNDAGSENPCSTPSPTSR